MAALIASAALAHSPLINCDAPEDERPSIQRYRAITATLGERVRAARPDVVVIIGQDHFRTLFYDLMPAFVIGTGRVDGWGDWGTATGPFPCSTSLARHLHRSLLEEGFDPACSYDLRVDHGVTQPLQLLGLPEDIPLVPVLINTGAPPMPSPRRCHDFGAALGRAIRSHDSGARVVVIGSGGISHAPPSWRVESEDPADAQRVQDLIHGRSRVAANEDARREGLVKAVLAGRYDHSVRRDWDEKVLREFAAGRVRQLAESLDEATIERDGGSGGQEIRTWLAASAAWGPGPMEVLGYEPIRFLITGMGAVVAGA